MTDKLLTWQYMSYKWPKHELFIGPPGHLIKLNANNRTLNRPPGHLKRYTVTPPPQKKNVTVGGVLKRRLLNYQLH